MPAEQIHLDPPDELDMAIGPAMFTQRAIRRFDSARPLSEEVLKIVVDAASKAPSGGTPSQRGSWFSGTGPSSRSSGGCITKPGGPNGATSSAGSPISRSRTTHRFVWPRCWPQR